MNAVRKNELSYRKTGMVIMDLPETLQRSHPEKITIGLEKLDGVKTILEDTVVYRVSLDPFPVSRGDNDSDDDSGSGFRLPGFLDLTVDKPDPEHVGRLALSLKNHPQNRPLIPLFDYLVKNSAYFEVYGRQYKSRFYVSGMKPVKGPLTPGVFEFLTRQAGVTFTVPQEARVTPAVPNSQEELELAFRVNEDRYPPRLRRYLADQIRSRKAKEAASFILLDWRAPTLELPEKEEARRYLDSALYGMEPVKEQILLLLERVRRSGRLGENILLVGPPGVGKTTIAQTIAGLFHLPESVVPMAFVQDAENFVGFGRTYKDAKEGMLTATLTHPKRRLPDGTEEVVYQIGQVLFLNELDKAGQSRDGSTVQPELLRMLDNNREFYDVYHEVAYPLEHVMIVADANSLAAIQDPLKDRFNIIEVPAYGPAEKIAIFRRYTFPKVLKSLGVAPGEVEITEEAGRRIGREIDTPGIREQEKLARRIVGDYLLHHAGEAAPVRYTAGMVEPFLAGMGRSAAVPSLPGVVRAVVQENGVTRCARVGCRLSGAGDAPVPGDRGSVRVLGCADVLTVQELEAACLCARELMSEEHCDITIQITGLTGDEKIRGQLGFAAYMAVLSAWHDRPVEGAFFGAVTMWGELLEGECSDPDGLMFQLDRGFADCLFTARGFSPRLRKDHRAGVIELTDADVAAGLCFGGPEDSLAV